MTDEIKKRGRKKIHSSPNELVCTVTGKTVKTNHAQFTKCLAESGLTQEEYIRTYVSREGRKILRLREENKQEPTPVVKVEETHHRINESQQEPDDLDDKDIEEILDEDDHLDDLSDEEENMPDPVSPQALRSYPIVYGTTVMDSYNEYRAEGEPPKEAWSSASHLHRSQPRFEAKVRECDRLIPCATDSIKFFGLR